MRILHTAIAFALLAVPAYGQTPSPAKTAPPTAAPSSPAPAPEIEFFAPSGYMPMKFSDYKGLLMLDPDRAAGLFLVQLADGAAAETERGVVREKIARMFASADKPASWKTARLAPHRSRPTEVGEIATASVGETEVQVTTILWPQGTGAVIYGYFAMRHTAKPAKDDGRFLDADGKGVDKFDELRNSIKSEKIVEKEQAEGAARRKELT